MLACATPLASGAEADAIGSRWLEPDGVDSLKFAIAVAGALLLLWEARLRHSGRQAVQRRLRNGLLVATGVAAGLAWPNFLEFRYGSYLHGHDMFHYYVGSKYLPELGYTRLYECTALADARAGQRQAVLRRKIRSLETYEYVPARRILTQPRRCTRHFTKARWEEFQADVSFFRERIHEFGWRGIQVDHGFNGTPVWALLGGTLARTGPMSESRLLLLALLDPLLLALMWLCVGWAFGWLGACVALIFWGTFYPAEFLWIGGSVLRQTWLASTVMGICLLRRNRPAAAGFALAFAALLRIFPLTLIGAVALSALLSMWRERRWRVAANHVRFALGILLALVTLVPLSVTTSGGLETWHGFSRKILLHRASPPQTAVGLKMAVSSRYVLPDPGRERDSVSWQSGFRDSFESRRPLYLALVVAFLLLLAAALRGQEDWAAAVLGAGAALVLTDLTGYYASLLLVFGFLAPRQPGIGAALCALSAITWLCAWVWGPKPFYEVHPWVAAATVGFIVWATTLSLPRFRPGPRLRGSRSTAARAGGEIRLPPGAPT